MVDSKEKGLWKSAATIASWIKKKKPAPPAQPKPGVGGAPPSKDAGVKSFIDKSNSLVLDVCLPVVRRLFVHKCNNKYKPIDGAFEWKNNASSGKLFMDGHSRIDPSSALQSYSFKAKRTSKNCKVTLPKAAFQECKVDLSHLLTKDTEVVWQVEGGAATGKAATVENYNKAQGTRAAKLNFKKALEWAETEDEQKIVLTMCKRLVARGVDHKGNLPDSHVKRLVFLLAFAIVPEDCHFYSAVLLCSLSLRNAKPKLQAVGNGRC